MIADVGAFYIPKLVKNFVLNVIYVTRFALLTTIIELTVIMINL